MPFPRSDARSRRRFPMDCVPGYHQQKRPSHAMDADPDQLDLGFTDRVERPGMIAPRHTSIILRRGPLACFVSAQDGCIASEQRLGVLRERGPAASATCPGQRLSALRVTSGSVDLG
jgi:hypothetical protein